MSDSHHKPTSGGNRKVFLLLFIHKKKILASLGVARPGSGRVTLELCGAVAILSEIRAEAERYVRSGITNRGLAA